MGGDAVLLVLVVVLVVVVQCQVSLDTYVELVRSDSWRLVVVVVVEALELEQLCQQSPVSEMVAVDNAFVLDVADMR